MAAIPLNLLLEKGTDWDATFNIQNEDNTTPLNLTGYTAEAKMKKSYYSTTSTSFVVTFVDRYNGQLQIGLANAATAALEAQLPAIASPEPNDTVTLPPVLLNTV